MNRYGYIVNKNYPVNLGAITWKFYRVEEDETTILYEGIELPIDYGVDFNEYFIFDNVDEFKGWMNQFGEAHSVDVEPSQDYSLFNDNNILCYKIPEQLQSITEKQYGSYYLPKVLDMNGNIIAPIWIAYDDNFMEIWVELRSLEQIKFKPING